MEGFCAGEVVAGTLAEVAMGVKSSGGGVQVGRTVHVLKL